MISFREQWKIFTVVATYWIVSMSIVFINKALLSRDDFNAPFFVTWSQCLVTALIYSCYNCYQSYSSTSINVPSILSKKIIKSVFPLSIVFALTILFSNLCLKHVDVSFYYIGRSLTTVFNVILTYALLKEKTSAQVCCCCAFIVFGFWLGIDQEKLIGSFSFLGTLYGILGSLTLAYYSIRTKKVLPVVDNKIWILAYYINTYSCALFVPLIFASGEVTSIRDNSHLISVNYCYLLIIGGLCGLAIGYVTALQIKVTSPLTHNISGTAKACAQTVVATYYYKEAKPLLWWLSNWIVLGGSAAYTGIKQRELNSPSLPTRM